MASENDPTTTDTTVDAVPAVDVTAVDASEPAPENPWVRGAKAARTNSAANEP